MVGVFDIFEGCENRISKTPIVSVVDIDDSMLVRLEISELSMLAAWEGVMVGTLETESKNVVHPESRALPDVICIVLPDELRDALDFPVQIGHVREEQLTPVKVLGLHVHYLLRWVGLSQLHRGPERETTELEQGCAEIVSDHLLHRQDEFEQVTLRGSARDNII